MQTDTNIFLPIQINQLIELVKQLPKKEKQKLIDVLQDEVPTDIPEWQKQEVRKRIKRYEKNPALLVDEKTALKAIKAM